MNRTPSLALCVLLFLVSGNASACTIPVFRYALDRWPPAPYIVEADAATIEAFRSPNRLLRNVIFRESDAPHHILPPFPGEPERPFWSGQLDAATFARLTDSPLRREIVRRLTTGETAVWVLIESGHAHADEEMSELLEARLAFFQSVARLPTIDPNDPTSELGPGPPVDLRFSILRLTRETADEEALRRMLLGPEIGKLTKDEPVIAPVFGRGRVLGAWPASMMDEDAIDEACYYLTGACSCQVKDENPGWDLLITADWDAELRAVASKANRPPAPVAESTAPETVVFGATSTPRARNGRPTLFLAVFPLLLIIGAALSLFAKDSGKAS